MSTKDDPTTPAEIVTTGVSDLEKAAGLSNETRTADREERVAAASASTEARVLTAAGQRATSTMWESTQRTIAITVVRVTLFVTAALVIAPLVALLVGGTVDQVTATAAVTGMVLLANLTGTVTGFYFGRTNHQRVGAAGDELIGR